MERPLRLTRVRLLVAAAAVLVLAGAGFAVGAAVRGIHHRADTTHARDVIANLWEWPWPSVAQECVSVLGPAGYGAVQVAPPEDSLSVEGHPWWDVYQPVGYDLNSRFGDRTAFAAMVAACHQAGVRVYVDAVINHMTGADQPATTGYGGATYTRDRHYPAAGYTPADFHSYPGECPTSDGQIADFTNQTQVQECELLGLLDLRTESEHVRGQIAGYLNDLLSLGVDGFRIDAAKHISVADLAAIKAKLRPQPSFWVQEVMPGVPPMSAYEGLGSVLEFTYAANLRGKFRTGISGLERFGTGPIYEPSDRAVVFVANHDTERDGSTLSYQDGSSYTLANVFMLAWNYGTPTVMSSFAFTNFDQAPPMDASGFIRPVTCGAVWLCQHRTPAIANMVGFHNVTRVDPTVSNWWSDGTDAIAFSRGPANGALGWIAINAGGGAVPTLDYATGLAPGTYCDLVHGRIDSSRCLGPTVTVAANGHVELSVPPSDAIAIDTESRLG
jgi:alpha-amylase